MLPVGGLAFRLLRDLLRPIAGHSRLFLLEDPETFQKQKTAATTLHRSGVLSAMKHMLNLYLLGVVLTMLSIFVRLMETLGALVESPLPGNTWTTRGQLTNTESPKSLPDHQSRGVQ